MTYGGCNCNDCPTPNSYTFFETTDTTLKRFINGQQRAEIYNKNSISVYQMRSDQISLSYYVLDQPNEFILFPSIQYFSGYTILPTLTAGFITYSNVLVHQTDTTNLNGQFFVWKSYYNKEKGIIAFEDKKTNSFFYRTN